MGNICSQSKSIKHRGYKLNWYKEAQTIATHLTDEESYSSIMSSGKFIPSSSGWNGPGLYAHIGDVRNGEGKGKHKISFDYSDLKISDGEKPIEFSQERWDQLRTKDNRTIDKELVNLGYDGEIMHGGTYIRIFPESVGKISPI